MALRARSSRVRVREPRQRGDVGDLVVRQPEFAEVRQVLERGQVGNAVARQAQALQARREIEPRDAPDTVADGVPGA